MFLGVCALSLSEGRGQGLRSLLCPSTYEYPRRACAACCVPLRMNTLYPEVRSTGFLCVRVPKPHQQQHRTTTPAAAAVASRRRSRVLAPQRENPTLAVGRTCPFKVHTVAVLLLVQQYNCVRKGNAVVIIPRSKSVLHFRTEWYEGVALGSDL